MTRHPFDSGELGRVEPELDRVGELLERYAAAVAAEAPMHLAARIRVGVDEQPRGHGPIAAFLATWSGPARAMAAGALLGLVVVGAVALGQLVDRAREQVGATPSPSVLSTPSPTVSPSPSPTLSPTPTPTQRPTPIPTAQPSASDEVELETPEPSESDNSGSGSDNSGPGGGGGGSGSGNSGPGGGGDEP